MSKHNNGWLAIVCAYRKEETDLAATLESAAKSAGKGAVIIAVEDKDRSGPGRNRHRGIEAAKNADAVILIDAHMRFQGDVLRRMGMQVKASGGLIAPFCHHNDECSFDKATPKGAHFYAGARIVYKCTEGKTRTSLAPKWSTDTKPGPRACVMGACYAFRRDWYYTVGQPLSMLTGWGCDEELLSIATWMSGHMPQIIDGHVAHLWRERTPWPVTPREQINARLSHSGMVNVLVPDAAERADLDAFGGLKGWVPTAESERLRLALLKLPRGWIEWKQKVCSPEEIDGVQVSAKLATPEPAIRTTSPIPRANYGSAETNRVCKCGSAASKIDSVRRTGRMVIRYRICDSCGARRTTQEILAMP